MNFSIPNESKNVPIGFTVLQCVFFPKLSQLKKAEGVLQSLIEIEPTNLKFIFRPHRI